MKKQSRNIVKYIYYCGIALLLVSFISLILEKSQVTNFYTKNALPAEQNQASELINNVQYTPADPTDNNDINKQKEDGTIGNSTIPSTDSNAPINITLTAAGQDEIGGPVIIKVLLTDVSSGTCDVILSKDNVNKSYSSSVINNGTYYSCEGFSIPYEELESGTWSLSVTVTSSDRSGTKEQTIQVKG